MQKRHYQKVYENVAPFAGFSVLEEKSTEKKNLAEYLVPIFLNIKSKNIKVLDLAGGSGLIWKEFSKSAVHYPQLRNLLRREGLSLTLVDSSEKQIEKAKENLSAFKAKAVHKDIENFLEETDGKYDVVVAVHFFPGVEKKDHAALLTKIGKKVSSGGKLIVIQPGDENLLTLFKAELYKRVLNKDYLPTRLSLGDFGEDWEGASRKIISSLIVDKNDIFPLASFLLGKNASGFSREKKALIMKIANKYFLTNKENGTIGIMNDIFELVKIKQKIKYISFDLDGTLSNIKYDKKLWNEELPKIYAETKQITLSEAKKHTYSEMYKALFIEKIRNFTDIAYWFKRYGLGSDDWDELLKRMKKHFFIYEDSKRFLKNHQGNYKFVILTSTERKMLEVKLGNNGIIHYFEKIFSTPSDFNISMKNRDAFEMMFEKLGINAQELIHVGDDKHMDFNVPRSLGARAYFLSRDKKYEGENIINNLDELSAILKNEE